MPALKNPRYERFAQLLASGKTATGAHEEAGFKRSRHNASHLAAKPEIGARVQQITTVAAERAVVTVESLIAEAEEARAAAMADGQYAAAVAAIKEKGVLSGKRIERRETGEPGEFQWMERASEQQLVEFIETGVAPKDVGRLN
jgi:phage terminase small subunit